MIDAVPEPVAAEVQVIRSALLARLIHETASQGCFGFVGLVAA